MKYLYIFLFAFLTFSVAKGQQDKVFDITFKIKGVKNETAILGFYYGDKKLIADSIKFDEKKNTILEKLFWLFPQIE